MNSMTETMTAQEWADRYGVTLDWSARGFHADKDGWEHQLFTVTLERKGAESVSFDWRQGLGVESEPDVASVLPALRSDAESGDMAWIEFCDSYGMNPDSISDNRVWEACREARRKLYDFMSSEAMWEEFLSIESD